MDKHGGDQADVMGLIAGGCGEQHQSKPFTKHTRHIIHKMKNALEICKMQICFSRRQSQAIVHALPRSNDPKFIKVLRHDT